MKFAGAFAMLILSGFPVLRCGATVYHSDGTAASVQSIHNNQAHNGDTITLPAGTFIWTSSVRITKAITLQGAGAGQTVVKDGVQGNPLILWTLAANYPARLTGVEFQDGGRTSGTYVIRIFGSNTNGSTFRFDHCKWNQVKGQIVPDTVIGVIDHNDFIGNGYLDMIRPYGSNWNGKGVYGDGSWSAATGYGSAQWLFIEDNTFSWINTALLGPVTDAYYGARFVVRHNTIYDGFVTNHGTESTGRPRGCRAMEVYGNTFIGTGKNRFAGGSRSGGTLYHDNSISGYWGQAVFSLVNYRNIYAYPIWGGADGTNAWDVNEPTVFFTGTAASNSTSSGSSYTVTVSGNPNWTTNQWAGYTIRRTSNNCSVNTLTFGWILSNTSNTITYIDNDGQPIPQMSFCTGDSLEIRKVDHAIDQPGRALGSLISGDNPTPPPNWNDQVTEPCYSWNNVNTDNNNAHSDFEAEEGVRLNIHFYNETVMPGYTSYTYPHPLVSGAPVPTSSSTLRSTRRSQQKHYKKQKKGGWRAHGKKEQGPNQSSANLDG
jgi:hypothetical protein